MWKCELNYWKTGWWGNHHILLTNRRLHLKDFFFLLKNPVEPWSLINYRKSTDDCCFLLAKSDFSVSLIPCHNLHPVYLSRSPSLSLCLCLSLFLCVWVCACVYLYVRVRVQQTVHPILSGRATLDWGHTSLTCLSSSTKTDLDQRWLQQVHRWLKQRVVERDRRKSLDGLCDAATSIMSLKKRTPALPLLRGLPASSPALWWHDRANLTLMWPPAGLGSRWKSPRCKKCGCGGFYWLVFGVPMGNCHS